MRINKTLLFFLLLILTSVRGYTASKCIQIYKSPNDPLAFRRSGRTPLTADQPANIRSRLSPEPNFVNTTNLLKTPHLSQQSLGLIPSGKGVLEAYSGIAPPETARAILVAEYEARKNTALFDLREVEIRNLGFKELAELLNKGPLGQLTVEETQKAMEDSMAFLYDSYRAQGPERELLIPEIKAQDDVEALRVTHFLTTRWIQPLVHVQILTSLNESEKLHVEEAWPEQAHLFARRNQTERIGELGRLFALSPNSKPLARYEETLTVDSLTRADMSFYQFLTIKNAINWGLYEARLDRILQQTNLTVERVLIRNGFPLHKGERVEVKKKWIVDGKETEVIEVVYSFDRNAMIAISNHLMKFLLKRWVEEFDTHPYYRGVPEIFFKFMARDLPSLQALGLIGTNPSNSIFVFPEDVMTLLQTGLSRQHFIFTLKPEQVSLLRDRIKD